jgi:hypothetical protein
MTPYRQMQRVKGKKKKKKIEKLKIERRGERILRRIITIRYNRSLSVLLSFDKAAKLGHANVALDVVVIL